jgi:Lar family restriction alleviation protein
MEAQMRRDDLEPCPFCGGKEIAVHPLDLSQWGSGMPHPGSDARYLHCDGCGADGPQSFYSQEAIEAWNRRSALSAALSEQTLPWVDSEWRRVDRPGTGSVLLYTLREEGYRRGEPVTVNDVMINVDRAYGSETDIEPIVQRVLSALVDNSHASEEVVESLDDRMKAAGMYTVAEMMGVTPLTRWMSNPAINSIGAFSEWLDRKVSEYLRMKAAYDLGDKDESDELYEWVQAHSAVYSTIRDQFQVALSSLRPAEVGSATATSGTGGGE